jgi:hypothetical protein
MELKAQKFVAVLGSVWLVLLTDYQYWDENYFELEVWLTESNIEYELEGSVLTLMNDKDMTLFTLRWQ